MYTWRAAAESGWDFSSRWFSDPMDIRSIHTTDIIPVDLNCLLYHLEITIAKAYGLSKTMLLTKGLNYMPSSEHDQFRSTAGMRTSDSFVDYDYINEQPTSRLSLAAAFPLFTKIATKWPGRVSCRSTGA